ncbi:transposase, partial [Vibrio sp. Y176]|uniref:transposase n=1 Tax=Vibrio sp. Y176 TaxID=3074704 RepID=UPI002965A4CB
GQIRVCQKPSKKSVQLSNSILWTDKTKINYQNDGKTREGRREGTAHDPKHTTSSVKHGGGSVMVWGCFAGGQTGDLHKVTGILNQHGYHSILQRHAIPSGLRLVGQRFTLQQDNDPKHTSKLCQRYLAKKEEEGTLRMMTWPAQSPDLNPIELVWDELDRKVKNKQPTSAANLYEMLTEAWEEISSDYLMKLIARMPRVCEAVIKAKGGYFDESKI